MESVSQGYSEEASRRTVFVLLCALFFALGGVVLVIRLARLVKHSSLRRTVASCFGRPVGFRSVDFAKQVAAKLQERRMARALASLPYGIGAISFTVVLALSRTTLPGPRRNSITQDVALMVVCFATLLLWACPRLLTKRTLDIWSSSLVACTALAYSPIGMDSDGDSSSYLLPFGATLVVSQVNMNVRLNLAWICMLCASICSTIMFGSEGVCGERLLPSRVDRVSHVIGSALVFMMVVASFHHSLVLVVQYDIEAHTSRNELQAARSVLLGVCDAVVELDSEFRLQDGASELVNMLLLNPQRSLQGEDLRSFLASQQDREKFTEQMGRAWLLGGDIVGLSAAFHVSMKDSSSIPLDVEVFCVRFVNRDGHVAYFAGIREFTDISPMLKSRAPVPQPLVRPGRNLKGAAATPMDDSSQEPSSHGSSSLTSGSISSAGVGLSEAEGELVAWIDVLTADYTVRHSTPAFARHVDARAGFLSAMCRSQRDLFVGWAQEAWVDLTESRAAESSGPAHLQYPTPLHFKCPAPQGGAPGLAGPGRARPVVTAVLGLDLARPPGEQDHGRGVVRVVFQEPRLGTALRDPQRRRQSSCGTPSATAESAIGQLRRSGNGARRGAAGSRRRVAEEPAQAAVSPARGFASIPL